MGIDTRDGFQVECIDCARCVDACHQAMSPRKEPGIIGYTFGTEEKGWRALLEPRIILIGLACLLFIGALLHNASDRTPVSFKLRSSPSVSARLIAGNKVLSFYDGYFRNLSSSPIDLTIVATLESGEKLQIKGPGSLTLQANEKRLLRFGIATTNPGKNLPRKILFSVYSQDGKVLENKAFITHISEKQ